MYKILLSMLCLLSIQLLTAQTNPTPTSVSTLPGIYDFGTVPFSTPLSFMASWTGDGVRPYTTQAAAEASGGGADQPIIAAEPVSGGSGGQYGGAPNNNARLSILQSGNATSGTSQIVLAMNTTGAPTVTVRYTLTMPVVNTRDIGIALQYRIGSTGAFTTLAGSAVVYSNASSNGGDVDGPTDDDTYNFTLPAAAANQPLVQLRWVTWQPSGTGSRSAIALDNISLLVGSALPCATPTAQPTALSVTPSTTTLTGNFTAATPPSSAYLVVYSTASTLTSNPVDGVNYNPGQALGGGTVVQLSSATSFSVTGLTPNTTYYSFVFSADYGLCTGSTKYLTVNPLTGNTTTTSLPACTTPAAAATNLSLTPSSSTITGSFTASASANNYLVVRSTNSTLSASPTNGTTYTVGAALGGGTVVQYGASTNFTALGLAPNTQYYLFVFAANGTCIGEPFYLTTSLNGSATTLNNNATGYYNSAAGLTCQALKTALYNKISSGTAVLSYTPGVWNAYLSTDTVRNNANTATIIYDMYSNRGPGQPEPYQFTPVTNQCGNYNGEGQCYNREHTVPQSWFNSASPMVSDIHHLVPTDGSVNGQRGNFPYGPVGTVTYTSQNGSKKGNCSYPGFSGTVFEPINEFKGDFARMQFYMAVRYENVIAGWQNNSNANDALNGTSYQVFDDWYLKMLYDWHIQDPVSAKEIARNNAVFAIQGNRNPFIDSAQYVYRIWSCTGVLPLPTPTPVVLNVSNKCITDVSARGKVANPPVGATLNITLDGSPVTFNATDSTFQYFTQGVTTAGAHIVRVTYTNALGSSFKDTAYTVAATLTPTNTISGVTTVFSGQITTLTATPTDGGTTPAYLWQDSTSAVGWTNIAGATNSSLTYTPAATGHKIRCRLTSSATGCVNNAPVLSNVLTFTVNTTTAITPVNAANYGIVLAPNPVGNTINLSNLKIADKWLIAEVVTLLGKTKAVTKNIANATTATINVEHLAAGMYVLVLRRNSGASTFVKFVKL